MIQEKETKRSAQTLLSGIILAALIVVGVGIFRTQFQYNPSVLQKNAFLKGPDETRGQPRPPTGKFFKPLPKGTMPLTPAETFDTQTLSDKIDGKAELYLSAGFKSLVSQRFKSESQPDFWMEAFVYDMENSQNAFSVFSTQRRKGAASLDLTENAYRTSNALFFTRGPYYVEIISSQKFEDPPAAVKKLAETFIVNTPSKTAAKSRNASALFPKEGLAKNSISLIAANAFGHDGFDKIYTAEYQLQGQTLMAYLSHRESPQRAKEMASAYAAFLLAFGGKNIDTKLSIPNARVIEVLDTYEITFSHGPYLAGVREAATVDSAETLAQRLYEKLQETGS